MGWKKRIVTSTTLQEKWQTASENIHRRLTLSFLISGILICRSLCESHITEMIRLGYDSNDSHHCDGNLQFLICYSTVFWHFLTSFGKRARTLQEQAIMQPLGCIGPDYHRFSGSFVIICEILGQMSMTPCWLAHFWNDQTVVMILMKPFQLPRKLISSLLVGYLQVFWDHFVISLRKSQDSTGKPPTTISWTCMKIFVIILSAELNWSTHALVGNTLPELSNWLWF